VSRLQQLIHEIHRRSLGRCWGSACFGHTRLRDRLGLEAGDVLTMKVLPGETN